MSDKETTSGLSGAFGNKGLKANHVSYGHPHGKEILEEILDVLKQSPTGVTLFNVHTMYKFPIQIIKGTGESGFSPQSKIIYIQIPGAAQKADGKHIIQTIKALREAEHEIIGFTAPDPSKDFMKYASVMHAKNLDSIVYVCKVMKELTNSSRYQELLDALVAFDYSDVYKAYMSNASEKELFDAYEGR
ncbi:MAG: hypothetical protein WC989_02760 [Micavibrio sp.]